MRIIAKVMDWNRRTVLHLYHGGGMCIAPEPHEITVDQFIQLTPLTAFMLAKELKKWARAERKRTRKIASGEMRYFQMKGWTKK